MRKIRTVFVGPPALSDVIRHLFHGRPEFEFVGNLRNVGSLSKRTGQLLPELIIANVKPVNTGVCSVVVAIKRSSPSSRLILICPIADLSRGARRCGADAFLDHENLVRQLVPVASALSAPVR